MGRASNEKGYWAKGIADEPLGSMNSILVAAKHLRDGGVLAYPTDTLWGLGVDARSHLAISKLNAFKGRSDQSAMSLVVRDIAMASKYVQLNKNDLKLLELLWPGPTTFIFESLQVLPSILEGGTGCLGLRCFRQQAINDLMWEFEGPITTTSANPSSSPPFLDSSSLRSWLPETVFILENHKSELTQSAPQNILNETIKASTIVKIQGQTYQVLRPGGKNQKHLIMVLSSLGYALTK